MHTFFFCSDDISSSSPWIQSDCWSLRSIRDRFKRKHSRFRINGETRRNTGEIYIRSLPRDMTTGRKCEERFPAAYARAHTRARNETERDRTRRDGCIHKHARDSMQNVRAYGRVRVTSVAPYWGKEEEEHGEEKEENRTWKLHVLSDLRLTCRYSHGFL